MKPYRCTIEWVVAESDLDEAQIQFDSAIDWIERGGGHVQGGFVGLMPSEDVVPDSPLARDLVSNTGTERDR